MKKVLKILLYIVVIIAIAIVAYFVSHSLTTYFLEKQASEQEELSGYMVGEERIDTMICEINSVFQLEVPDTFTKMDEDTLKTKYPSESRPGLVYTNSESNINVAISITSNDMTDEQIQDYLEEYRNLFASSENINLIRCEEIEQNGIKMGRIEMITPAIDTSIYNNMCFFQIDNKQVIVSFNCKESQMNDWQEMANIIINSVQMIEKS